MNFISASLFALLFLNSIISLDVQGQVTKILIVTGGKDFETDSFFRVFNDSNIKYDTLSKPGAFDKFESQDISQYKCILFYDAYQPITEGQKNKFLKIFDLGIGCIFLHHSLVSHQDWDEYAKIVGGKYFHNAYEYDGKKYGPSTYKHDQDLQIHIIDKNHPVTKDLNDFLIHDEIYMNFKIENFVTPFLTSDNCENGKYLGWTHQYKNSKIVYLQLGHDHQAYENPNYSLLINNAIKWSSKK